MLTFFKFFEHRSEGLPHRLSGGPLATPAESVDPLRTQAHHGNITPPASITAAVGIVDGLWVEGKGLGREIRDLAHREGVRSGYIKHIEWLVGCAAG